MIGRLSRSLWVRALVTAGVLAILLSQLDIGAAADAMLRIDARAAILVLLLLAVDRAVMVWRWFILLRATGTSVPIKSAAWIYLVSSFLGSFLPAGIGGDAARAYTLAQRTAQGGAAVASVAVDRLLGLLSIVTIAMIGLLVAGPRHVQGMQLPLLLLCVGVLTALATLLWSDRWAGRLAAPGRLSTLAQAMGRYRHHGGALSSVFLLSIAVQGLRILQAWLMGAGIGIRVPFTYYLLFMPVGLVALMLPISVNGFGVPQGVIVWLLRPVGVQASEAFALSTLIVLSGIAANLPGAWLYLRSRRATPPKTFTSGPQKV